MTNVRRRGERQLFARSPLLGLAVLAAVFVVACDRFPQQERIGVGLAADGAVQVHFVLCRDQAVQRVEIIEPDNADTTEDDTVVFWEIESRAGSTFETYTVGETYEGLQEVVEARDQLPSDRTLVARVELTIGTVATKSFVIDELEPGLIHARIGGSPPRNVPPDEFRAHASSLCLPTRTP